MVKKAKKETKTKEVAANINKKSKKSKQHKKGFFKSIFNYFKEMKSELKKVTWPTKKGVFNGTMTVFIMVMIIMSIVVSSDFIFSNMLKLVLGI